MAQDPSAECSLCGWLPITPELWLYPIVGDDGNLICISCLNTRRAALGLEMINASRHLESVRDR